MCRFLALMPTSGSGLPVADVYALLFERKFKEAVPALEALCGSLTKGDVEAVNALAFLVKPKEK